MLANFSVQSLLFPVRFQLYLAQDSTILQSTAKCGQIFGTFSLLPEYLSIQVLWQNSGDVNFCIMLNHLLIECLRDSPLTPQGRDTFSVKRPNYRHHQAADKSLQKMFEQAREITCKNKCTIALNLEKFAMLQQHKFQYFR